MRDSDCDKIETNQNPLVGILLEFVRAAVLDIPPIIPNEISIDWDKLMDLSHAHGILAWVWEGICKLPSEQQPPRQQRINWGLSAQEVHERYYLHREKLLQMVDVCSANGMRLLLLKGIGLSSFYPNPSSRQSRDIDIYLFGDCERGNEILLGGEVELHGKHYVYSKDGIEIENHIQMFSNVSPLHKKVEDYLESAIRNSYKTEDGYYMMPQECMIIYLLMHSLIHLCHSSDPIRIQNIVDFGMVLKKSDDGCPYRLHSLLASLDLEEAFRLFVSLSEWVLDIDLSRFYPQSKVKPGDFNSAVNFIMDENLRHPAFSTLPKYRQLFQRWNYYKKMKWRYKYIPTINSNKKVSFIRDFIGDLICLVINNKGSKTILFN